MRSSVLIFGFVSAFVAGCATVNDGLVATNQALDALNSSLAAGLPAGSRSGGGVYVPDAIKKQAGAALTPASNQETSVMIADAKPYIENFISLWACGASNQRMTQYLDSGGYGFSPPTSSMQYHKSGCLVPLRVHGWEKRSANALYFVVDYVSPQSEETARRGYNAIKQPSGEWLFRL